MVVIFWHSSKSLRTPELCPKSCTILQYSGKLELKHVRQAINGNAYITIWYKFKVPEYVLVTEEYLIYDSISMIGAVGGTLGMCIGFSFDGIIHYLIHFLPSFLSIIKIKLTGTRKYQLNTLNTGICEIDKPEDQEEKILPIVDSNAF